MTSHPHAGLQRPETRSPISYTKVLLVEGMTSFQFFKALLRTMGLLNEVEIRNFGGVDDFSVYLEALIATSGFSDVISLGIVRDAEDDVNKAFASVSRSLMSAGLDAPPRVLSSTTGKPRVSVFILPDGETPGMLETLCMRAFNDDAATQCISEYFDCLADKTGGVTRLIDKARIQAFLASRERPGLQLGEAAHAGYVVWDNPAFDSLKTFLRSL
jgi:uncharacterized protein DUF3226